MTGADDPSPSPGHATFRSTLHGTVFAGRERLLDELHDGDRVLVIPDPPGGEEPEVWIHLATGEPVGHLPPEIAHWLWPRLQRGERATATALRVHGEDAPSWRRVVVEVELGSGRPPG
ncbi:MAG TPA: hypothetical protein VLA43_15130 [Longimicrobiales bacterium]|nr:hypothetical protein [Longimicrobiales bacterium]